MPSVALSALVLGARDRFGSRWSRSSNAARRRLRARFVQGPGGRRPSLAIALTVFLLAQAGVPLTSGFVAKFGVIRAAVEERSYTIGVIAMVAAVIAAFFYLRIMVSVWLEPAAGEVAPEPVPFTSAVAITAAAVLHTARRRVARLASRRHRHRHPIRPLTPPGVLSAPKGPWLRLGQTVRRAPRFCLPQRARGFVWGRRFGSQAGVRVDSRRSATRRATRSLLASRFISRSRACSPSASRPLTCSTSHCRSTTGTRICSWWTARS